MKKIKVTADTLDECLEQIAEQMKKPVSEIKDYTILQKGGKSLLGLIHKPYIVAYTIYTAPVSDDYRISEALRVAEEFDGFFIIDYKDGAAMLTIFPPGGHGIPVGRDEIIERAESLNLKNIDVAKIEEAVKSAEKIEIRIADWPDGQSYNSYFKIEVEKDKSGNKMFAYCTVYPPKKGGSLLTEKDVLTGLENQGIIKGILTAELKIHIEKGLFGQKFLIARGKDMERGRDAYLKYHFNAGKEINFIEKSNGSVDFKEMNLIETTNKGTLLAEKFEPTSGIDGYDIFGKVIKADPGKDLIIKNSYNTYLDAGKQKVYAAKDGEPVLTESNEIAVNEICTINGDVNYSTGNINFIGTVIIEGRVEDNFTIAAKGDIIIKGNVGKSFLEADGNIVIDGGIVGKNEGIIKSGKSVYARFIESANVYARQNIICRKMIMHSQIAAGIQVRVMSGGERGALIGGVTRAGESVTVNELGAIGAAITTVEVGTPPETIEKLSELDAKKQEIEKKLEKINLGIQTIEKRGQTQELSTNEKAQLMQLQSMYKSVSEKLNTTKFEAIQLKRNSQINTRAKIQVYDKLFANVHTFFGGLQRNFSKEEVHVRLGLIDGKISILSYD